MQGHLEQNPKNQPNMWGNTFSAGEPGARYTDEDPDCMFIDPEAQHPSATWIRQLPFQLYHCVTAYRRTIVTKAVNFNTPHILLLCSYFLVSSTCINLWVSTMVKLNSALKYIHTDLYCSMQMPHSFHIIIWNERNCWLLTALNLRSNESSSMCSMQKVMGPWPAPCQNNNDYWCTYDQRRSVVRPSDISIFLLFHHNATPENILLLLLLLLPLALHP